MTAPGSGNHEVMAPAPGFNFFEGKNHGHSSAHDDDRLEACFTSSLSSLPMARKTACEFAQRLGATGSRLDELMCAVGEALANALDHGSANGSALWVRAWGGQGAVVIEIEDAGPGFDPQNVVEPIAGAEHGYGIAIMREMVDAVEFSCNGRRVRLRKSVP